MMGIEYGAGGKPRSLSAWSSTSEFDDFLSASIGEEPNGRVSVRSMLGRLGIDPWRECAQLADLPRSAAIQRLTSLVEQLAAQTLLVTEPDALATNLIARLPRRASSLGAPGMVVQGLKHTPSCRLWMAILLIALAVMVGEQAIFNGQPAAPTAAPAGHAIGAAGQPPFSQP